VSGIFKWNFKYIMMEKFLIEVPHAGDKASCMRAIQTFLRSGSHFVTNAEWGCTDGEHKAWMIVEVESKEEAKRILPSHYRVNAKITRISKFTRKQMDEAVSEYHH
jgi:hypothetical protein